MRRQSVTICAAMLGLAHVPNSWRQCEQSVLVVAAVKVDVIDLDDDRMVASGREVASVFRFKAGEWILEADLPEPAELQQSSGFGRAAAIDGLNVLVGAPREKVGAVVSYRFDGANWVQGRILRDEDVDADNGEFGAAIAIDGDTAVIGAQWDNHVDNNSGAARVLNFDGEQWVPGQFLLPDSDDVAFFGRGVDIQGETIVVSSFNSVYVLAFDGVEWVLQQRLAPDEPLDNFGYQIRLHGEWLFVSEWLDDNANGDRAGAVHIYRFDGRQWVDHQKLIAKKGATDDEFGASISVMGDRLFIGAPSRFLPEGRADLFELDGDLWTPTQTVHAHAEL